MVRKSCRWRTTTRKRVRELVEQHPSLANAAVDWGFGDWEDALGAAAHTGRREIAEVLLAHGARDLDLCRGDARPARRREGVRGRASRRSADAGPHGITLMSHAKAGGPDAAAVVKYLEEVGDADRRPPTAPLDAADRDALVGRYAFGAGPRDHFDIDVNTGPARHHSPGHVAS